MLLCNSFLMETHPTMLKSIRASDKMAARRMIALDLIVLSQHPNCHPTTPTHTKVQSTNASETLLSHSFNNSTDFLLIPGDNDWSECYGYNTTNNTDSTRELWRSYFATETSPFNQFSSDFPGDGRPTIYRQEKIPRTTSFPTATSPSLVLTSLTAVTTSAT